MGSSLSIRMNNLLDFQTSAHGVPYVLVFSVDECVLNMWLGVVRHAIHDTEEERGFRISGRRSG
jgi:hypothetical protein